MQLFFLIDVIKYSVMLRETPDIILQIFSIYILYNIKSFPPTEPLLESQWLENPVIRQMYSIYSTSDNFLMKVIYYSIHSETFHVERMS